MKQEWISTEDKLPKAGKYVLARHNRGTWGDKDDQENVNCVVVKLVEGITEAMRDKMKQGMLPDYEVQSSFSSHPLKSKRSQIYRSEDEHGNNLKPYYWSQFGPDSFFGQSITYWMYIPSLKLK